jgi:hypothetical protein
MRPGRMVPRLELVALAFRDGMSSACSYAVAARNDEKLGILTIDTERRTQRSFI